MYQYSIYNGGITREQFLFYETKITAMLLCQGYDKESIINKITEANLYQFPTERMVKSIANGCWRRLEALENCELIECLATSSIEVAKQINLYAMMRYNRIVWDFMVTVVGEKYRTQDYSFSKKDVHIFLNRLREQVDGISDWTDETMKKIAQVLIKCLVECGYLENAKSEILLPVSLCPELENGMRSNGDQSAFSAFNYFE